MAATSSSSSNTVVNLRKRKGEEDLQNEGNVKQHQISSDTCPRWNTPLVKVLISVFHEYVDGEVKAGRLRNIIFEQHEWESVDGEVKCKRLRNIIPEQDEWENADGEVKAERPSNMIPEQDEWEKLHRTFIDRAIAANCIHFETKDPVTASETRDKILAMIRNSSCELEDIKVSDMELWQKWETCCAHTKWATMSSGGIRTMSTRTRTCVPYETSDVCIDLMHKTLEIMKTMDLSREIFVDFGFVMWSNRGAALQLFVNMKKSMRLEYIKMQIANRRIDNC